MRIKYLKLRNSFDAASSRTVFRDIPALIVILFWLSLLHVNPAFAFHVTGNGFSAGLSSFHM